MKGRVEGWWGGLEVARQLGGRPNPLLTWRVREIGVKEKAQV